MLRDRAQVILDRMLDEAEGLTIDPKATSA